MLSLQVSEESPLGPSLIPKEPLRRNCSLQALQPYGALAPWPAPKPRAPSLPGPRVPVVLTSLWVRKSSYNHDDFIKLTLKLLFFGLNHPLSPSPLRTSVINSRRCIGHAVNSK